MVHQFKSPGFCSREPRFDSQYSHGSSQPSLIPAPGDPVPSFVSLGTRHAHGTQTHIQAKWLTHKSLKRLQEGLLQEGL